MQGQLQAARAGGKCGGEAAGAGRALPDGGGAW